MSTLKMFTVGIQKKKKNYYLKDKCGLKKNTQKHLECEMNVTNQIIKTDIDHTEGQIFYLLFLLHNRFDTNMEFLQLEFAYFNCHADNIISNERKSIKLEKSTIRNSYIRFWIPLMPAKIKNIVIEENICLYLPSHGTH